jgi:hypothetical protein
MEFNESMIAVMNELLTKDSEFILPIEELDGIRVEVKIIKICGSEKEWYVLVIGLLGIYDKDDKHLNYYSVLYRSNYHHHNKDFHTLPEIIEHTMMILENFIVDDYNGCIVLKKFASIELDLSNMFRKFQRVKVKGEECCVCKDIITKTKTTCGHHVCIRCVSKLKMAEEEKDYDEDETEYSFQRKCPMCRQSFHSLLDLKI